VGAVVTWFTWFAIVCAGKNALEIFQLLMIHICGHKILDVGAYFVGKRFGKHKLSTISQAAGAASPNKTVEGAIGGALASMAASILGAWLMQWPLYVITGSAYGLLLSMIALLGDLTASMMKRDAKLKDSGQLLPGHGGLLDRIDSYLFTAPAAFFFCRDLLPIAMKWAKR
jgi:phosphatidate cytidylyltransferase